MRSYTQIIHPHPLSKNKDTHTDKSIPKNNNKQASTSQQSTNPQPNLKAPRPVLQTKITKTHANLMVLPIPSRPELIQQLYLSHNNISSVRNKLRVFVSLRNLNLSYNLLDNLEEFIGEIVGNVDVLKQQKQARQIGIQKGTIEEGGKIQLKMLCIRMNKFPYGYQDQIIRMIDTLQRFEDFNFTRTPQLKTKDPQSQNPRQIFQIAHKVGQYFLPSYSNLLSSIRSLTAIHSLLFQQQSQSLISSITSSSISDKYEKTISKLAVLLQPKKQIKYMPCTRKTALLNILQIQMICIELGGELSGLRLNIVQKNDVFKNIVKDLLMIYNNRNNFQLLKTLQERHKTKNKGRFMDQNNLDSLCQMFGQMYKAIRYTIYQPNPGKYLTKLDPNEVRLHPLVEYLNHDNQREQQQEKTNIKNINTLDGNRRRTKNTMLRQFKKFVDKEDKDRDSLDFQQYGKNNKNQLIYENMPIIVYQRNYLEVIQQIWQLQLKSLIKIYDLVFHKLRQTEQNLQNPEPKFVSFQLKQKQDGKTVPLPRLPADVYLREDNEETMGNSRVYNHQMVGNKAALSKDLQIQCDRKKYSSPILIQEQKEIENVQKNQQNKKTLPKFGNFSQENEKQHKKPSRKSNDDRILTEGAAKNKKQQVCKPNLDKYTIYQINLAYKVLTALKKNKNKSKRARAKANPESNNQSYNGTQKTKKLDHKNKAANINQFTFKYNDEER